MGFYTDANVVPHGFLRTPDGNIISFDAPGAGLGFGLNEGTVATGINDSGEIGGQYEDSSLVFHGFVRYADGSFATFDAPGAGTGAFQGTIGDAINSKGEITGYFYDANNVFHGFVRDRNGSITTFDAPGAGTGALQGTFTLFTFVAGDAINSKGEIAESFIDANNVFHGFVRDRNGVFTTFEAPGESDTDFLPGTSAVAINSAGDITGDFSVATDRFHCYLRDHNGKFTTFGAPGANLGTFAAAVNSARDIAGWYFSGVFVGHAFVRDHAHGTFTSFDAPDAGTNTSFASGTYPTAMNDEGAITGESVDNNNVNHGFLRSPGEENDK